MNEESIRKFESELGLKRLRPSWAKAEIFIGLGCVWLSMHVSDVIGRRSNFGAMVISFGLFIAGGYLAMAGSRSHLYQSNNRLAAYFADRLT